MKKTLSRGRGSGILVLLIFGIFAVCVMTVLVLGAKSYNSLVSRDELAYRQRSGTQYIAAKLRHSDSLDSVEVGRFSPGSDIPCLFLRQDIDGDVYLTRIYCYGGYIRELFSGEYVEPEPEDGQEILPAEDMTISMDGGLLTASVTDAEGVSSEMTLSLRSGKGGLS